MKSWLYWKLTRLWDILPWRSDFVDYLRDLTYPYYNDPI